MTDWPTRPLGEVVRFVGGGTPRRDRPDHWGGGVPWASVKDLTGTELSTTAETITEAGLRESSANLIAPGTVVVASRVGLGKAAITARQVAINQDLKALVPIGTQVIARYLLYYFVSIAARLAAAGVGATVRGITLDFLSQLRIPLPPLPEQQRLVRILDEADALRRLRAQAEERAEDLTASLYASLFLCTAGRPTWRAKAINDLAREGDAAIRTGPFGSQLLHSEFADCGVPVLGIDNVVSNEFRWTVRRCLPPDRFAELRRFQVFPGDVLVTIMGTVGRCCVAPDDLPDCMSTKHLCAITLDRARAHPRYVWGALLFDPDVREQMRGAGGGAVMAGWNSTIIRSLRVRVPPLELQRTFAARVAELRALQAAQAASRKRLDDLFQSLLHRAFAGEL